MNNWIEVTSENPAQEGTYICTLESKTGFRWTWPLILKINNHNNGRYGRCWYKSEDDVRSEDPLNENDEYGVKICAFQYLPDPCLDKTIIKGF